MSDRWYARPVVFVADIDRAAAFYVAALGFAEDWRHADGGEPLVAQVSREGCELILSCQQPEKIGRGLIFVSLDQDVLLSVRAEFEAKGVVVKEGWWGYRLMVVDDVDGNQLYFPYENGAGEAS